MLKVYPASRFFRAPMWIELKNSKEFKHFLTARWLHHFEIGTLETPKNSRIFWPENVEDIQQAEAIMCYAEPDDILGGALIECGIGLALGKRVYAIGSNEAYRSWIHHPLVFPFEKIEHAVNNLDYINDIVQQKRLE